MDASELDRRNLLSQSPFPPHFFWAVFVRLGTTASLEVGASEWSATLSFHNCFAWISLRWIYVTGSPVVITNYMHGWIFGSIFFHPFVFRLSFLALCPVVLRVSYVVSVIRSIVCHFFWGCGKQILPLRVCLAKRLHYPRIALHPMFATTTYTFIIARHCVWGGVSFSVLPLCYFYNLHPLIEIVNSYSTCFLNEEKKKNKLLLKLNLCNLSYLLNPSLIFPGLL